MGCMRHEAKEIGWGLLVRAITHPIKENALGPSGLKGFSNKENNLTTCLW